MNVLVSAFDPFNGQETNKSQEVLELLENDFHKVLLPTSYQKSFLDLQKKIDQLDPDLILMMGESSKAKEIELERVAINYIDCSLPDNDGNIVRHRSVNNSDYKLLESKINFQSLERDYKSSYHAGTYVCNCLYFKTLYYLLERKSSAKAIFVHLATDQDAQNLSLEIKKMIGLIRI